MQLRWALALLAAAYWDAWRLLAMRIEDEAGLVLTQLLVGAILWRAVRADPDLRVSPTRIATMLGLYAVAAVTGPALLQIGAAVVSIALVAWHGERLPRLPLAGLALLALPVLPTLDFLLAWPLRRVSAMFAVALLNMNGLVVGLQGVAMEWQGRQILFDGPCSGVRMLWGALILASLLALLRGYDWSRYARTMFAAIGVTIIANAVRAASLFYVENGLVAQAHAGWMHAAIGLMAFGLLAACLVALSPARRWSEA